MLHHSEIEQIERDAFADLYGAVDKTYAGVSHVHSKLIAGCLLLAHKGLPAAEFNRVFGLNLEQNTSEQELDGILKWLAEYADPAWAVQIVPDDRSELLHRWLGARGVRRSGNGWAKFERDASPVEPTAATNLRVKILTAEDAGSFGSTVATGFSLPSAMSNWFSTLVGRSDWRTYLAYDDDKPAACGAMYLP